MKATYLCTPKNKTGISSLDTVGIQQQIRQVDDTRGDKLTGIKVQYSPLNPVEIQSLSTVHKAFQKVAKTAKKSLEVKVNSPYLCRPLPRERGKKAGSLSLQEQFFPGLTGKAKGSKKASKNLKKSLAESLRSPYLCNPNQKRAAHRNRARSSNSSYE